MGGLLCSEMGVGVLSVDSVSGFKQLVPLIGPEKELL